MIASVKKATVAYRCPHCGLAILAEVDPFILGKDMLRLKCDCGESELMIVRSQDGKVRLTVPCILCPQSHNYTLSDSVFFDKELFTLACTYSGLDICFIGKKELVDESLRSSEQEILELLGDADLADIPRDSDRSAEFFAEQVADVIAYMLAELAEEKKIHCRCPEGNGRYTFAYTGKGVLIRCECCGAEKEMDITNVMTANDFLQTDELTLE